MSKNKRVKLIINNNEKSLRIAEKVKSALLAKNFEIVEEDYSVAISIGGDGAFLRMVKETGFNSDVLYVGVNAGTLGFAQDIEEQEILSFIESLEKGDYTYEEIGIAEATINTPELKDHLYYLNELIIRDSELNTTKLDVYVDGVLLEEYVGDGLLVSTSFGSTAYNLSFGGSIVYNTFHTLQLTPVAPLNNRSYRNLINSVVMPGKKNIEIKPKPDKMMITIDGDNYFYDNIENLVISIRDKKIKLIRKKDYNFITKINDKFLK